MEYLKPVMSKQELLGMGFTRAYLDRAIASPGQTFAWQTNPANKHSPVMFDTQKFDQWRCKEIAVAERARKQRIGVM